MSFICSINWEQLGTLQLLYNRDSQNSIQASAFAKFREAENCCSWVPPKQTDCASVSTTTHYAQLVFLTSGRFAKGKESDGRSKLELDVPPKYNASKQWFKSLNVSPCESWLVVHCSLYFTTNTNTFTNFVVISLILLYIGKCQVWGRPRLTTSCTSDKFPINGKELEISSLKWTLIISVLVGIDLLALPISLWYTILKPLYFIAQNRLSYVANGQYRNSGKH